MHFSDIFSTLRRGVMSFWQSIKKLTLTAIFNRHEETQAIAINIHD